MAVRDDADAEALIFALRGAGYEVVATLEHTTLRRLATARLRAPRSTVVVDLLFASSAIEDEITAGAEELELVRGLRLPVATLHHLIALKVLSRDDRTRPQDAQDLRALLAEAGGDDIAQARAALERITARGGSRGRDLVGALERAVEELGPTRDP